MNRIISKYAAATFSAPPGMYDRISPLVEGIIYNGVLHGLQNIRSEGRPLLSIVEDRVGSKITNSIVSNLESFGIKRPWIPSPNSNELYSTNFCSPTILDGWDGLKDLGPEEAIQNLENFLQEKFGSYRKTKTGLPCLETEIILSYSNNAEGKRHDGGFVISQGGWSIKIFIHMQDWVHLLSLKDGIHSIEWYAKTYSASLHHELIHVGQYIFGAIHGLRGPGGLPLKKLLKENPNEGDHQSRDIEFQTYLNEVVKEITSKLDKLSVRHHNSFFTNYINSIPKNNPVILPHDKITNGMNLIKIFSPGAIKTRGMDWFSYLKEKDPARWRAAVEKTVAKLNELNYNIFQLSEKEIENKIAEELMMLAESNPRYIVKNIKNLANYSNILENHPQIFEKAFINYANQYPKSILVEENLGNNKSRSIAFRSLAEKNPKYFIEKYLDDPEAAEYLDLAAMNFADKHPKEFLENQNLTAKFSKYVSLAGMRLYS